MKRAGGSVQSSQEGYGGRIRGRRLQIGLTQVDLAERAEVSRQTVIAMESGSYAPSVFLAIKVAKELDTTVEYLWGNV